MIVTVSLVIALIGLVLLILAALGVPSRVGLGWLGLACWLVVDQLLPRLP